MAGQQQIEGPWRVEGRAAVVAGALQQVFDTMDYDNAPSSDLVELLLDGMQAAGYTV